MAMSGHAPRQKAADGYAIEPGHRPHHRLAETIRLSDHSVVRNVDPFAVYADAIVDTVRFGRRASRRVDLPVGILDDDAVCKAAAQASAAREMVEP